MQLLLLLKGEKTRKEKLQKINTVLLESWQLVNKNRWIKVNSLIKRYFPKYNFALLIHFLKSFFLANYHQGG